MTLLLGATIMDRKALRVCVERAMADYYHASELLRSPLCQLVYDTSTGGPPDPADLRALLRETLERLRPPERTLADDPAWLPYRVVTLHYLQSQPRGVVCEELAISQATFYRYRRQALDAMADDLWRWQAAQKAERERGERSKNDALGRAVSAVAGQHREPLDLVDLADGVRSSIMRMPEVNEGTLSLEITPSHHPIYSDPTLLRQVLFALITDALHEGVSGVLTLRMGGTSGVISGSLEPFAGMPPSADVAPGLDMARRLVEAAGGCLQLQPERLRVAFTVPSALPPLVICLDDDADASRLYGVYLSGRGYRVHGVTNGDELRSALRTERPDAIVLDVLMPQEDGWAILEELQADSETAAIPVIICSVLQQPDLALAMGAKAVLTKPVTPGALCQALDDALA